jgi:hypothetical protein
MKKKYENSKDQSQIGSKNIQSSIVQEDERNKKSKSSFKL